MKNSRYIVHTCSSLDSCSSYLILPIVFGTQSPHAAVRALAACRRVLCKPPSMGCRRRSKRKRPGAGGGNVLPGQGGWGELECVAADHSLGIARYTRLKQAFLARIGHSFVRLLSRMRIFMSHSQKIAGVWCCTSSL